MSAPRKIFTYGGQASVYCDGSANIEGPVIVFVPGLGGTAGQFFEHNTIFESALQSGFRAAVVNFEFPGGKSLDMWSNGRMLAKQLSDICLFFNTKKVIVIAHSKGGVDSQAAAVYFGAEDLIDRIITLSTPHWGSQLADIAYSSAGWAFAELVKAHSPGCFAMQTGCMSEFRKLTDDNSHNTVPIQTFAGNGGSDELTRMWFSSILLDRFGENDGVVTVKSAHNPKGKHMGTFPFNHAQMGEGKFMWKHLEPVLKGVSDSSAIPVMAHGARNCHPAHILKGGRLQNGADESFYIDSTVKSFIITISFCGKTGRDRFRVISPSGKVMVPKAKAEGNGVFIYKMRIEKSKAGKWKLKARRCCGAYTAIISLEGDNPCQCPPSPPGKVMADMKILRTYADRYDVIGEYNFAAGSRFPNVPELKNGMYNLELNLHGELYDGSRYDRTMIRPIAQGSDLNEFLGSR